MLLPVETDTDNEQDTIDAPLTHDGAVESEVLVRTSRPTPPSRAAKRMGTSQRLQTQFEDLAGEIQQDRRERAKQFEELMSIVKTIVKTIEGDQQQ